MSMYYTEVTVLLAGLTLKMLMYATVTKSSQ
jgi:hypothetical protein